MTPHFVAYYRVSTAGQGRSGLGLDAQRRSVADYLERVGGDLVGERQDIESGKSATRPGLLEAIHLCRLTGATLLIAKLDRLSRNAAFLLTLKDSGVRLVAADMPDANDLTVGIMALVAQQEREAISARTKAGLASIKAKLERGETHVSKAGRTITRLGGPPALTPPPSAKGVEAARAKAAAFVARVLPTVAALRGEGLTLAQVAERLNAQRILTSRGGTWTPTAVKRVLDA